MAYPGQGNYPYQQGGYGQPQPAYGYGQYPGQQQPGKWKLKVLVQRRIFQYYQWTSDNVASLYSLCSKLSHGLNQGRTCHLSPIFHLCFITGYPGQAPMNAGPPPGADPTLWSWFITVDRDRSGQISTEELRQALMNNNWSHFNLETCRLMIGMRILFCNSAILTFMYRGLPDVKSIIHWKIIPKMVC